MNTWLAFFFSDRSNIHGHGNCGEHSEATYESALCSDRHVYQHGSSIHDGCVISTEIAALRAF